MTTFSGRLTADMVEAYSKSGYWHADTFHDVLARRTDQHPDHEVLYDGRFRVTYRELADRVDAVAAMLQAHGIGRHDVVTIQLPNWIEFASAFLGVVYWEAGVDVVDPAGQRVGQGFVELNWARTTSFTN